MTDAADAHTAVTSLKGKRVAITGGTTGIGRAIAVLLASEGATVFICGRDERHLTDALARVREVGKGDGIALDLADEDGVARFFAAADDYLGGLDVAVINAAVGASGLSETDEPALRYAIATDFTAYLLSAHAAVERMNGKGHVVLTGSMSAHVLGPGSTIYAGIKFGIQGFAEALRREMGPKGVRVSLVEPGLTGSDMIEKDEAAQRAAIAKEEMLCAEDIAVGVHYLLTQPNRVVVQQLVIAPRAVGEE